MTVCNCYCHTDNTQLRAGCEFVMGLVKHGSKKSLQIQMPYYYYSFLPNRISNSVTDNNNLIIIMAMAWKQTGTDMSHLKKLPV